MINCSFLTKRWLKNCIKRYCDTISKFLYYYKCWEIFFSFFHVGYRLITSYIIRWELKFKNWIYVEYTNCFQTLKLTCYCYNCNRIYMWSGYLITCRCIDLLLWHSSNYLYSNDASIKMCKFSTIELSNFHKPDWSVSILSSYTKSWKITHFHEKEYSFIAGEKHNDFS